MVRLRSCSARAMRRLSQLADTVPGARADTGFALLILGSIALAQEQFDRAASWIDASLEHFQRAGNDWGISEAQDALGAVSYCTGRLSRERHAFTRKVLTKPGTSASH